MAIIIKTLGGGTISAVGSADLYTVGASKSALVHNVRLVNGTTASTSAMNLYVKPSGGTARRIAKQDFTILANGLFVMPDPVTMGTGDKIQINISTGASPSLGYMVNGVERDT